MALVYGFTEAAKPDVGWTATSTVAILAAAIVLLVAFVVWESRTTNPLLPLRIALDRNRGGSYLVFLLVAAGLFAMFLFLTFYFQAVLGYSPLRAGFALLPFSGGIIVSAGIVSQLLPRVGPRPLMVIGLTMAVVGMLSLIRTTPTSSYLTHVFPAELLLSVGLAGVFIPASSTALVGVGGHDAGVASALLNTTQQIGGSLGTALLNTLYASAVTGYLAANARSPQDVQRLRFDAFVHGYHVSYFWGAMLLAAGLVATIVFINAKKDDIPTEPVLVEAEAGATA